MIWHYFCHGYHGEAIQITQTVAPVPQKQGQFPDQCQLASEGVTWSGHDTDMRMASADAALTLIYLSGLKNSVTQYLTMAVTRGYTCFQTAISV